MAQSLKAVTPRRESRSFGRWLARFLPRVGPRPERIDHLNERMLRDIGLSEREFARTGHSRRRD